MIKQLQNTLEHIRFYLRAANSKGHGTHSPLVYEFITKVLNDDRYFYAFDEIEPIKNELLNDRREVEFDGNKVLVASIAQSLLHTKYNQLLFRIVAFYKPTHILEVGSVLGITTAYLASPDKNIRVHTVNDDTQSENIARQNLSKLSLYNVTFYNYINFFKGNNTSNQKKFGLIVINNAAWVSEKNINQLLNLIEEEAIVIFTGINKSLSNKLLCESLVKQSLKTFFIELFNAKIIFIRKDIIKNQSFAIRF